MNRSSQSLSTVSNVELRNRTTRMRLVAASALLALFALPIQAQTSSNDRSSSEKLKQRSAADGRRERVDDIYHQLRNNGSPLDGIYGDDDRQDIYEVSDPFLLRLAQSVCIVLDASDLVDNGDETYTLPANRWTSIGGIDVCPDEPFRGQYQVGFCSGFLVGPDLIATAGHCVSAADCGTNPVAFVFGYDQPGANMDPPLIVPADDVYFCDAVIDRDTSGDFDHSILRVDRPVVGRNPVPIRRTDTVVDGDPLVMIGHPVLLPKKIDDGGQVQDANGEVAFFMANVDAYGGSSGSPVFNLTTGVAEGILVRGNPDWDFGACVQSIRCQDGGCPGWEEISKSISFAASVPTLGMLVQPVGDVMHIGRTGGPFDPARVDYTLSNVTANSIDYEVRLVPGGDAPLLIDGDTVLISGTINVGDPDVAIAVTLDPSANGLPAGSYTSSIEFEDLTHNLITTRDHTIEVGQTGFQVTPTGDFSAGGPQGGPFTDTLTYTITSDRPTPLNIRILPSAAWISINGQTGALIIPLDGIGDFAEIEVGFSEAANGLPLGLQQAQVDFQHFLGDGRGDTSRSVELDVGRIAFSSSDTPIVIDDNSEIVSTIEVSDAFCIADVDVEMNVTHTFISDLVIELESPNGTIVRLHNRSGGSTQDINTTYDDDANPPDGPGALADFVGEIVTGVWTLRVSDHADFDTGSLDSWTLELAAGEATCPPAAHDLDLAFPSNRLSVIQLDADSAQGGNIDYIIASLPTSGALHDPNAGPIDAVPYVLAAGGDTVAYEPPTDFTGRDAFTYKVNDGLDSNTADVTLIIGTPLRAFFFDLETEPNPPWTTDANWTFGQPAGGGGQRGGPDPTRGFTGNNVYGYNLLGDYTNNMAESHLTSSPLDCTGLSGTSLVFRRWLGVEDATYDRAYVRVSTDGALWTTVWENQTEISDAAWQRVEFDISNIADDQPAVSLRWTMGATDGSLVYCGWNIDDIEVLSLMPRSVGDVNCDDQINAFDIEPFLLALFDPAEYANSYPDCRPDLADINGDGAVNAFDIEPFLDLLFGP